jgi:hypothetical protein
MQDEGIWKEIGPGLTNEWSSISRQSSYEVMVQTGLRSIYSSK